MNPLAELRARLEEILTELRAIDTEAGDAAFTDDQQTKFDELRDERTKVETKIANEERRLEERSALAKLASRPASTESGDGARNTGPAFHAERDPFAVLEDRSLRGRDLSRALVDANLRANEHKIDGGENQSHFERVLKRHAGDHRWAENILGRSRDEYADGFAKLMTGSDFALSNEERAAVAIGTTTQGGFLVPTHLDPTLMLTNSGSSNVMRQYARQVTLTEGNVWYGVTTAGVTASWDAELAEVSDDSPAVGQESITCFRAQSLVQASIQAFQDISGLATDVMMLFADARDRLEGAAHMTGAGSTTAPLGLFTAINASASLHTVSTTAATIGEVDIHALYRALPVRWRGKGTFVANPLYTLAVKRLGTAVSSSYSGDLTQAVSERWLGRPVVESDDAPTTQTTTALDQEIVFADLSAYTIVDKPGGFSVEFIPHLFHTDNNLPKGVRGWYAHWRMGAGMPNLKAGRLLVDKTSA